MAGAMANIRTEQQMEWLCHGSRILAHFSEKTLLNSDDLAGVYREVKL